MKEVFRLKTVIITGAAHGVGKAIAMTLKEHRLILIDDDEQTLKETASMIHADYYVCDVSDVGKLKSTVSLIQDKYDVIDTLINNAGLWIAGDMSKVEDKQFKSMNELERIHKVINTNLFAPIALTRLVTPIMQKQGYGQIINVNSQSGVKTEEPFPVYNASKTGGTAFRKAIQADLGSVNVRITDVCPGLIDTDFYLHADNELPAAVRALGLSAKDVADVVKYVFELPEHITIPSIELMSMSSI